MTFFFFSLWFSSQRREALRCSLPNLNSAARPSCKSTWEETSYWFFVVSHSLILICLCAFFVSSNPQDPAVVSWRRVEKRSTEADREAGAGRRVSGGTAVCSYQTSLFLFRANAGRCVSFIKVSHVFMNRSWLRFGGKCVLRCLTLTKPSPYFICHNHNLIQRSCRIVQYLYVLLQYFLSALIPDNNRQFVRETWWNLWVDNSDLWS